jgi:hypothetical protein
LGQIEPELPYALLNFEAKSALAKISLPVGRATRRGGTRAIHAINSGAFAGGQTGRAGARLSGNRVLYGALIGSIVGQVIDSLVLRWPDSRTGTVRSSASRRGVGREW